VGAPSRGSGNTPGAPRIFPFLPSEESDDQVPGKVFQGFPGTVLGIIVKPSVLGTVDAIAPTELQ